MSGYDHTLIGNNAGTDYSGGGFGMVGVGGYALYNTTGSYNTAFGYRAHELANGSFNTFLGMGAGKQVTGNNNTAVGFEAGQRHSEPIGTGHNNISIGHRSGKYVNPNADQNLFIGVQTAYSSSYLGNNNTIIGVNLLYQSTESISDSVVIGSYGNERLRINSSGDMAIAHTDPKAKLHVSGDGDDILSVFNNTGAYWEGEIIGNTDSPYEFCYLL